MKNIFILLGLCIEISESYKAYNFSFIEINNRCLFGINHEISNKEFYVDILFIHAIRWI